MDIQRICVILAGGIFCLVVFKCSELTSLDVNNDHYSIYLTGRVLDKDGKPMPNTIAKLIGKNLADTTNAEGFYEIIEKATNSSLKKTRATDTLDSLQISKEGQEITMLDIAKWLDTLPDVFIVQRDIYGNFTLKPKALDIVRAIITGDNIPDSTPKIVNLWYNEPNQSYSGFVYFTYSIQTLDYSVFVSVYDKDSALIGRSVPVDFPSTAGNINIPSFNPNNARPLVDAGNDTTVSINDTIQLHPIATDSFGGTINKWEWNINGEGFIHTSKGDTTIIAPSDSNPNYKCIVRVTDNEGNITTDSMYANICMDAPDAYAGTDTVVSIYDTILLHGSAIQKFGTIVKWEWSINGGVFVQTSTSDTIIRAPKDSILDYKCLLRVTDNDGNTSIDSMNVAVCIDIPLADAGKDTAASLNSPFTLHGKAQQQFGTIAKWEWDIGNTGFIETSSTDTTIVTPTTITSNFQCILRVTDDDGNSDIDTIVITLGSWQSLGLNGFDICISSKPRVCLALNDDTPYVAFIAPDTSARVMKYVNNSWIPVGDPNVLKVSMFSDIDLKIADDIPYLAASGYGTGNQFTVMKFDNGSWEKYDTSGTGAVNKKIISLAISEGIPYLAFRDQLPPAGNCNINVLRYTNNTWESLGSGVSKADNLFGPIYLLFNNSIPYIAYDEYLSGRKAAVKKYDNPTWEYEGDIPLPNGNYSLTMHTVQDSLIIAYSNCSTRALCVKKFRGMSWQYIGDSSFTPVYTPGVQDERYPLIYLANVADSIVVSFISSNQSIDFKINNGKSWESFLRPISISNARYAFALSKNNIPFIAYCNQGGTEITVSTFK